MMQMADVGAAPEFEFIEFDQRKSKCAQPFLQSISIFFNRAEVRVIPALKACRCAICSQLAGFGLLANIT